MVRLTTSILAATLLAIPALAASQQYERSVSESDLYTRSVVDDDVVVSREDLINILGRDVVADLEERDPWGLGMAVKLIRGGVKAGKAAHKAHEAHEHAQNAYNNHRNHRREFVEELSTREFDDLEEREPWGLGLAIKLIRGGVKAGKAAHKAHEAKEHAQNHNNNRHHRREFDEELSERDFDEEYELAARELVDDLEEREPWGLGMAVKLIRGGVKAGKAAHKAHEAHEHAQNAYNNHNNRHNHRREFEEDLLEREYYDDLD